MGLRCEGCGHHYANCSCPVEPRPARPEGWTLTEYGEAMFHALLGVARDHDQLGTRSYRRWITGPAFSAVVGRSANEAETEWLDTLIAEYIAGLDRLY